jgi:DNA-binding IclR family transcriptional regulator
MHGVTDETDASKSLTLIQSLQRGLRLVEAVVERGPMTARGMSDAIGIGLPTTYHLLRTLVHEEYLQRLAGGLYAIGPQLRSAAEQERDAQRVRVLRQAMCGLRDRTGATAVVGEIGEGGAVVTHLANSRKGPRPDLWVGMSLPFHATALGKVALAQLDRRERDAVLRSQPLVPFTFRTTTDPSRLGRETENATICFSADEFRYGISCVAVPLPGFARAAGIAVTFSSSVGAKRRRELAHLVTATAELLAIDLSDPEAA